MIHKLVETYSLDSSETCIEMTWLGVDDYSFVRHPPGHVLF
jgi:hypothetical protein